ncbi:MAG TPA: hypothetical protein VLV50_18760 [Stellaceae bacterium]|nr:hypothetical protein [Stellaceae bacterium]
MTARTVRRALAGAAALVLAAASALPAAAAPSPCYRLADIEADQAIRYQTELMVLSDTCNVTNYRDFTVRNRDVIVEYQKQLIDHFRRTGAHKPEASLDQFLTQIANELSMRSGTEQRPAVCARSASFLAEAAKLDGPEFRTHAAQLATEHEDSYRVCK